MPNYTHRCNDCKKEYKTTQFKYRCPKCKKKTRIVFQPVTLLGLPNTKY